MCRARTKPKRLDDHIAPSLAGPMPSRIRHLLNKSFTALPKGYRMQQRTFCSTTSTKRATKPPPSTTAATHAPKLTHVGETGSAHMVSISDKQVTSRVATAACTVQFSDATAVRLIRENQMKKGDVLGVARVAGIMAAKRTPDLIPLCHPIPISKVSVELKTVDESRVDIEATVACDGKTGVEMEALTAASTAALTVYDMCKAVDKGMKIENLRVTLKDGGKSGRWEMD